MVQLVSDAEIIDVGKQSEECSYFGCPTPVWPIYTYEIKNATVDSLSGTVWLDNHVLGESFGSLRRLLGWGGVIARLMEKPELCAVHHPIIAVGGTNYYHFWCETIPSVMRSLALFPKAKLLVSNEAPRFVREGLECCIGSEAYESQVFFRAGNQMISNLILTTVSNCLTTKIVDLVRNKTHFEYKTETPRKIFVSRQKSTGRSYEKENRIVEEHRDAGFEILVAESLPVQEQINVFSQASAISGLHGAGLANMLFCPAGAQVIEYFPPYYFNPCYYKLAVAAGHRYKPVFLQ